MLTLYDLVNNGNLFMSQAKTKEEYFSETSDILLNKKVVSLNFLEEIEKRESKFPTGLQTKTIGIAMPHVESQFVFENAIYITLFDKPVKFKKMDDNSQDLDVEAAFLLLVKDKDDHMIALQQLIMLFQNSELLEQVVSKDNKSDILEVLKENQYE